jgi:hypothetical protein
VTRDLLLLGAALVALTGCSGSGPAAGDGCASNRDCQDGFVCVGGSCVGGAVSGCADNADCPLGEYCDLDSHKCAIAQVVACQSDAECRADQRCNTVTGVCIDAPRSCGEGGSCPSGTHCDTVNDACVACLGDEHCTGGDVCRDQVCVDPNKPEDPNGCTLDTECNPPLTVCLEGACSLGCAQPGGMLCEDGAVCDTARGRCVTIEGPCATDPDCTPPMTVCESGQCIPGCGQVGGVQCPGGQECNPSTGRCRAGGPVCLSDDDCNAPQTVCNLFSGTCEPGCVSAGCTAPETCDTATGHCQGGATCAADRFEPNDARSAPAQINGGAQAGLTLCPGDDDYFSVSLGQGDSVTVTLSFVHGEGNLDLELYSPSGQVVASARGTTGTETFSYSAAAPGIHVVRVMMTRDTGPNPGNTYTLDIRAQVAPCPDDRYEENDTDQASAFISPGNQANLNVCVGDDDFYDVLLQGGDTLTVDLAFSHAEGDVDVQILGLLGIPLANGASSTDNESVSYTARSVGLFTIRVTLAADSGNMPGNPYAMNVTVTRTPAAMCTADGLEENDSAGAARSLTPGNQSNLSVCTGDDDFYAYTLAAGDDVTVNVSFSDAEGDIDVDLLNPAGTSVAAGSSSTDNESFAYTAAAAGRYVLRVYLYADGGANPGNTYALNVQVAGAATCAPDPFEPNDSAAAAAALPAGTHNGLTACDSDDDFYRLNLTSGQQVSLQALFTHAEGDIDMVLLDPSGTQVASSLSVTDDENINYTASQSGAYALHVELYRDGGSAPGNTYRLVVGP